MKKFSDFIKKSAEPQKKEPASNVIKGRFKITKSDDDKHLAFGWANVAIRADGEEIEDWQEDIIEPEELENAAYQYVLLYREGGEMHERGGAAVLVESVVFTEEKMQAMGIPAGTLPIGWWIGFKVTDEDVWEKVKDGTYPMFSLRSCCFISLISTPSIVMLPSVTSKNLGIRFTRVVLPLPVEPIKAVVSPGLAVKDISDKTASSASAYLKLTFLNSTTPHLSLIS